MIFTTWEFAVFFGVFFVGFVALRGWARKAWLLAANYLFYASWNPSFCLLLLGSTVLDFFVGRRLGVLTEARSRRRLLALSVTVNLGVLGFFKYANFFVDSAVRGLASLGVEASVPMLEIVLPVGISFYTFQSISYAFDVYRKDVTPTKSFFDFALYVSFFPQLVAGPIERAGQLLHQLRDIGGRLRFRWDGIGLIALGTFKKSVLADNFAALVEATYADPASTAAPALWIGTYAFAVQIYWDFSGYSDIAVGVARLLGVELIQNFRAPYAAAGPSDFWRRWHISLSTWLRDYLYVSLGGNRGSQAFVSRNLLLTMVLGGLWHGAAWNFILWGLFHGVLLVALRPEFLRRLAARFDEGWLRWPARIVRRFVFFHLVCFGWALFRAESLADCGVIFGKLLTIGAFDFGTWLERVAASGEGRYLACMMGVAGGLVLVQNAWPVGSHEVIARFWKTPLWLRFVVVVALFYSAMLLSPATPPPFIYFQF